MFMICKRIAIILILHITSTMMSRVNYLCIVISSLNSVFVSILLTFSLTDRNSGNTRDYQTDYS